MTVDVTPKDNGKWPVAPKTQAAGLGGGSGVAAAGIIVGLIQQYVTHQPLPQVTQMAVYFVVAGVAAFYAAYLAPHQNRVTPLEPIQNILEHPAFPPLAGKLPPGLPPVEPAGGTDASTTGK